MPFFLEILGNMCIVIICCPIYDVMNFGIKTNPLIKPFFYITNKVKTKMLISQERK